MKTIRKDKITELLDFLAGRYELFAPVSQDKTSFDFELIKSGTEADLNFYNTREAGKKLFFPQRQVLFSYSKEGRPTSPELKAEKQRVIFGLRPCDVKSLALLDKVFDGPDYKDPYYVEARKNTIIFALACNNPQSSCFCTSLGIGPFYKQGSDVFVIDSGDKYLLEPLTDKGKTLLNEISGLQDARDEDINLAEKLQAQAEAKITKKVELDGLPEKLDEVLDSSVWNEIHQRCLGCGICTYFCPTCHCFDIVEESEKTGGKRIRIWDSCMYPNFTREASGHNPRALGKERMRNRIMHKFSYFIKNNGEFACVGCGRCIRNCPVNMDITRAIEAIKNTK